MKYYSEEELKKWLGHSITLPFLAKLPAMELRHCCDCPYWHRHRHTDTTHTGTCYILAEKKLPATTLYNSLCKEGFMR